MKVLKKPTEVMRRANVESEEYLINTKFNIDKINNLYSFVEKIDSFSESKQEKTSRLIEPFALYNNKDDCWTLIAFCRLRKDFRLFRLERIEYLKPLEEKFKPHKMILDQFINKQREKARR